MNVLVISKKCVANCVPLVKYIQSKPELTKIIKIHDIHDNGVPSGVKRVPTLIKQDGTLLIGGDIKTYLDSFVDSIPNIEANGNRFGFDIGGETDDGTYCSLNSYGKSLAPEMTKELEEKINQKLEDAMSKFK